MFPLRVAHVVGVLLALWGTERSSTAQPRLEVVDGYLWGGNHPLDATFEVAYRVRNAGDTTLDILDVRPNCECVSGWPSKSSLAPGEAGTIDVRVNSQRDRGNQERLIELVTNDPQRRTVQLRLGYSLALAVRPTPNTIWFGTLAPLERSERVILVESPLGARGRIQSARCSNPAALVEVQEPDISWDRPGRIRVTLTAPTSPQSINDVLVVRTTLGQAATLRIPLEAVVSHDWFLSCPAGGGDFGDIVQGQQATLRLPLRLQGASKPVVQRTFPQEMAAWIDLDSDAPALVVAYPATPVFGPFSAAVMLSWYEPSFQTMRVPLNGCVIPEHVTTDTSGARSSTPRVAMDGS